LNRALGAGSVLNAALGAGFVASLFGGWCASGQTGLQPGASHHL
jgi:hypothetical protein